MRIMHKTFLLTLIAVMPVISPAQTTAAKPAATARPAKTPLPRPVNPTSKWQEVSKWEDPTAPLLAAFLKNQAAASITPTTATRLDYIRLAADNATYWQTQQNADGAIIDPYRKQEWQYSTPCFALAAIASVEYLDRKDLLEPAIKAMDWSCLTLSEGRAANHHEDFFPPVLSHALPLFEKHASPDQVKKWKAQLAGYDPYKVYRSVPGRNNWNVVATSGEYIYKTLGLRDNLDFVEDSLAGQGAFWRSKFGLYLEGPMAYDHFPRLWAADMVAHGYDGKYAAPLAEMLRRAAITSMFMQSPWGELPLGHRSAHHQWNEAEQCVTYEIYGALAAKQGNTALAGAYKRAAHLALTSMQRWQRPSGELYINKNKVEPEKFHGYEGYSGHSQYNLLPMAMLVIAHHHAAATQDVKELPAPADVGGFVVQVPELHKVFANAGGAYLEIETNADLHYDVTGLARIHFKGTDPQLGPSDVLTTKTSYTLPAGPRIAAAIGPEWTLDDGTTASLALLTSANGLKNAVSNISEAPDHVTFEITYTGGLPGLTGITQRYDVKPEAITVETKLDGPAKAQAMVWPVFADNGKEKTVITTDKDSVTVSQGASAETISAPGSSALTVSDTAYPNRNGWSKLARADFSANAPMKVVFKPKR